MVHVCFADVTINNTVGTRIFAGNRAVNEVRDLVRAALKAVYKYECNRDRKWVKTYYTICVGEYNVPYTEQMILSITLQVYSLLANECKTLYKHCIKKIPNQHKPIWLLPAFRKTK